MSHQFKGIPLQNNGENLCFCNSGTNALLSSEKITSRIFQNHCDTCGILCRLKNASLYPSVQLSARPLKEFVAQFPGLHHFRSKEQQDCDEFLQCILEKCGILRELTQSVVHIIYKCKSCKNVTNTEDTRNVLYEDLTGSSIVEIVSNTERTYPDFMDKCTHCGKETIQEHHEKILMLPEVLILKLQRY